MVRLRALLLLAVSASVCAPAAVSAAPPLVGQWPLDGSYEDGANELTADTSGNALALRAPNGSVHLGLPARFGTGATLGTNLTPLQVTSPLLAPAQVTLLAWIKQTGNPGILRYIAGRGDDGAPTCLGSTWALYTGHGGAPGLRFYVRSGAAGTGALTPAPGDAAVFNGQWHLVAGTYDGAAARLYVDGVPVGAPAPAPPPLKYALGGGSSFYVDGYPVDACVLGVNGDDWPGAIDEVRVYDRALSASELSRLAAAGPSAPDLVTDASLVPPPPPAPPVGEPAASAIAQAGPISAPQIPTKAVQAAALAQATKGLAGAAGKAPTEATQVALTAAQSKALEAMRNAAAGSQVSAAQAAKEMSAAEMRRTKPDPKVQARLEAMAYGIAAQVPAAAAGQVVEAVATIALEKKQNGKVRTQTIVLPPAVGIAEAKSKQAELQFPVDAKASAAMTKDDVAKAAMSVQAVAVDKVSELGELESLRLQMAMDRRSKFMTTLSNLLGKLSDTQDAITQNLKGGVTESEQERQKTLKAKEAKLDKQAKALEQQRDAANQQAADAMKAAVAALTAGALPTATTSLTGCTLCALAAR